MTTVREQIEAAPHHNARMQRLHTAWCAGGLVPADEVDARIADAVAGEREKMGGKSAQAYQVIGFLLDLCGAFESDEAQRILDYFADAEESYDEDWNYSQQAIREAASGGDDHDG